MTIQKILIHCVIGFFVSLFFLWNPDHLHAETPHSKPVLTKIIAAIPEDFPPTYFKDPSTGKPSGFAVDLMNEIGRMEGIEVEYIYGKPWDELIEMVRTGKADVVPSLTIAPERMELVAFTEPIELVPVNLVVSMDSKVTGLAPGLKIGTIKGSIPEKYITKNAPSVKVEHFEKLEDVLFALLAGRIDAAFVLTPSLMRLAYDMRVDDKINVISPSIFDAKRGIALRKGDTELLDRLNDGIKKVSGSPKYKELYMKWWGNPAPFWTARRIVLVMSGMILLMTLVMAYWRYRTMLSLNSELKSEVAERAHAEAGLKKALTLAEDEKEKTQAIIVGIGEGLSIQDTEYKIIYQNQVIRDIVGDHLGEYCYKVYEKKDAICDGCPLAMAFSYNEVRKTERAVFFPDGLRHFDITASPIKDATGKIVAGVEIVREVTGQKLAQEAIETEKEKLSVTLRSIGDGVIVTNISCNITLLNKTAEELTGWTDEAAKGRPLSEVFHIINEETREKRENPADKVIGSGLVVGLTSHTALIRRDGTEIIIADSAAPIKDRKSRTIGVVLVFRDITATYRMEKEMRNIQKIESLGVLAGGLAHDFNNLLTSIIGNISLAKMYTGVDHKAFDRLSEAEKAAERATGLTHQLLTFAKGGAPVKKLAAIVELVREAVNFALSGSSIRCIYSIPATLWSVEVDKGQMTQVFNNLIINSIQAMPEGGAVRIGFENRPVNKGEVPSLTTGDYVKITIRDEGIGIPEEIRGRIFDPFFTTKKKGSGLGLATVFSILKRHNGQITVESAPNLGTTFSIYIPAIRDTIGSEIDIKEGIQTGQGRILVMDDEPMVREVAGEILKALGYETGFAKDGKEAIDVYLQAQRAGKPFDIVIMDLTIPGGMGGKEAVKKLLEVAPQAKVIVSSGYSTDPVMADYREYGFCGVITKPYNTNQVSELISGILKKDFDIR